MDSPLEYQMNICGKVIFDQVFFMIKLKLRKTMTNI